MGIPNCTPKAIMLLLIIGGKAMAEITLNIASPRYCGTPARVRCVATESSTLIWTGLGFEVSFLRNSPPNTPVYRGDDVFVLDDVAPNVADPNFSNFTSTATTDASWIQCTNYIDTITQPLVSYTTQEPIADDGTCYCPEGGGVVTAMWSVLPALYGWDNVTLVVTVTCITCEDTRPRVVKQPIGELASSEKITSALNLTANNNYTFQVNATNACDDTIVRTCEATCPHSLANAGYTAAIAGGVIGAVILIFVVLLIVCYIIYRGVIV